MDELGEVDAVSLEREARAQGDGEAIAAFLEVPGARAVAGVRLSDGLAAFFIEVTSSPHGMESGDYERGLEKRHRLDRALKDMGFSAFDDDLDRIWELAIPSGRLAIDLARTREVITSALETDRPDPLGQ
jgi:hypothetical protein